MSEPETPVTIYAGKIADFTQKIELELSAHKVNLEAVLREALDGEDAEQLWPVLSAALDKQFGLIHTHYADAAERFIAVVEAHWLNVCQRAITEARLFAQACRTMEALIRPCENIANAFLGLLDAREDALRELLWQEPAKRVDMVVVLAGMVQSRGITADDIVDGLRTRLEVIRKEML